MSNPFDALGGQFAAQPTEAPAQQFAAPVQQAPVAAPVQAPVQQTFPQAPAAPAQGFPQAAPQAAPVAAAPVQQAPSIHAAANAPSPVTAGAAAFGTSRDSQGGGEKHKIRDDLGKPLLFRVIEFSVMTGNDGQPYDAVFADWVVLDPSNPQLRQRGMITNRPIVRDLKETLQKGLQYHLGRVKEVASKHPQPALALGALTDDEQAFAVQAGAALGWWPAQ